MYSTLSKRNRRPRASATSKSDASATRPRKSSAKHLRGQEERRIIEGSDNVFADVGFRGVEAENLKIRADLMLDLRKHIRDRGWTQATAARFFGETQPRISNLMKGEIDRFSIDKLINMLARAGKRVRVAVEARAA